MKEFFESKNIKYVEVTKELINDYLIMINDVEHVSRFIGNEEYKHYTVIDEIKWVESELNKKAIVFSMIDKKSDKFIGNIELMEDSLDSKELGIAITSSMQEKGYGTEAILTLINYGKNNLGLKRIFLRTNLDNYRAIHVYKKCGFKEFKRDEKKVYMEL